MNEVIKKITCISISGIIILFTIGVFVLPVMSKPSQTVKVLEIISGDTIKVSINKIQVVVKLDHIKAPSVNENGFEVSRKFLETMIQNRLIQLFYYKIGYSEIAYGIVYNQGVDINRYMVLSGFAKATEPEYHQDKNIVKAPKYISEQNEAIKNDCGLWSIISGY